MHKLGTDQVWEVMKIGENVEVMRQDGEPVAAVISDTPIDDARTICDSVNNLNDFLRVCARFVVAHEGADNAAWYEGIEHDAYEEAKLLLSTKECDKEAV